MAFVAMVPVGPRSPSGKAIAPTSATDENSRILLPVSRRHSLLRGEGGCFVISRPSLNREPRTGGVLEGPHKKGFNAGRYARRESKRPPPRARAPREPRRRARGLTARGQFLSPQPQANLVF